MTTMTPITEEERKKVQADLDAYTEKLGKGLLKMRAATVEQLVEATTIKEKDMKIGELYVVKTCTTSVRPWREEWNEAPFSPVIYLGKHSTCPGWTRTVGWQFLLSGDDAPVMLTPRDSRVKKFETFCKKEGYVFEEVRR